MTKSASLENQLSLMLTPQFPIPPAVILQQTASPASDSLCHKDVQLRTQIPAQELPAGSFKNVAKWVRAATKVSVGTTEDELAATKDFFVFHSVRAGDLMEAYGLLYRMRWIKYRHGQPNYELTLGKDARDGLYTPQGEFQKQRFLYMKSFINGVDQMSEPEKTNALSGQPLEYVQLSEKMKQAFRSAINALIEGNAAKAPSAYKPDINELADAKITLKNETASGSNIRELWIEAETNLGGFSFRWNDYDKSKDYPTSDRSLLFSQEPPPDGAYSKDAMVKKMKKLSLPITIPSAERTFATLLKYVSANYSVNIIANEDTSKRAIRFSCENLPLSEALDRISQEYGDWEWEASPGDFIVIRSPDSPRRRRPIQANP